MQKLMGDEGWGGGGLVFLYWPQVSVLESWSIQSKRIG